MSKEFNNNKNRKEFNNSLKDLLSATTSKECNDKGCPKIPTLQFFKHCPKREGGQSRVNPGSIQSQSSKERQPSTIQIKYIYKLVPLKDLLIRPTSTYVSVDNHKHSVTPRWFCFQQEMGCKEVIIISKSNKKHVSDSAHQNKYAFLTTRMFRPQIRQFI